MSESEQYEITDKGTIGCFGWFFGALLLSFLVGVYILTQHISP